MVGTDGEGMEETDGEVLDLVTVRCCLLMAHQHCCASLSPRRRIPWLCCCRPVWLLLARCGPVLCLNKVSWGEGGMGGTYLVSTTTNDECRLSFWLPRRCQRHGTCIPCQPRGVVSICWQLFPSVHSHFHPCMVVSIRAWSFSPMGGRLRSQPVIFIHGCRFCMFAFVARRLRSWPVICVRRRSVSMYIVVGGGHRVMVVAGGVILWSLWWLMEEKKNVTCCDIRVMFKLTREIT